VISAYPQKWFDSLFAGPSLKLKQAVVVIGEIDRPPGLGRQRAKIQIRAEPSQELEIDDMAAKGNRLFCEWAVFGLLDVLLGKGPMTLRQVRLIVEAMEIDEIHSSQMAFRFAGRDAGQKILEIVHRQEGSGVV
jgi:hypothetical protein